MVDKGRRSVATDSSNAEESHSSNISNQKKATRKYSLFTAKPAERVHFWEFVTHVLQLLASVPMHDEVRSAIAAATSDCDTP
eukprot:4258679-Prymnesium_polylepis.1